MATIASAEASGSEPRLWAPYGTLLFEGGSDVIGGADVFVPLWQRSDRLVFTDLRGSVDDDLNYQGNTGLAYRQLLSNGWIAGGYGFFDVGRTERDNTFFQGSAGVELMARDWEVRANGYVPGSNSERVREDFVQVPNGGGGNTLRLRAVEERALAGADFEGGWRVPVFSPEGDNELRVFAGAFYHGASGYDDLVGPQLRAELRSFDVPYLPSGSRFVLGAQYRWDDERGSWGAAHLSLRIPINFGGYGEQKLAPMQRRMVDRIARSGLTTRRRTEEQELLGPTGVPLGDVAYTDGATEGDARSVPTAGEVETAIGVAGVGGIIVALDQTGPIDPVNDVETIALLPGQILMGGGSSVVLFAPSGPVVFNAPGGRGLFQTGDDLVPLLQLADDNQVVSVDLDGGALGIEVEGDRVGVSDVNISGNTTTAPVIATGGVLWVGDDGSFLDSTIADVTSVDSAGGTFGVSWAGDRGTLRDVEIGNVSSVRGFLPYMLLWTGDDGLVESVTGGSVISQESEVRAVWILGERFSATGLSIGDVTSVEDDAAGLHWTSSTSGSIRDMTVGNVLAGGFADGAFWAGGTGELTNFTVGNVTANSGSANALQRGGGTGGGITTFRAGDVTGSALGGAGSGAGLRFFSPVNMDISDVVIGNVTAVTDGFGLGIVAQNGSNVSFDDIEIGNVIGRGAAQLASGLRLDGMTNVDVTDLTIGDVALLDGGANDFGARGIDFFGGADLQLSDFTVGNVTNTGTNGIARGIFYSAAGNSFVQEGTIGNVRALNTDGRAYGVDFTSDDGMVEEVTFGAVDADGEHAAIRFFNVDGGTANDLFFATIGPGGIGVLLDGGIATNHSGTDNGQALVTLGFQACVDNSGNSTGSAVEFDGVICP